MKKKLITLKLKNDLNSIISFEAWIKKTTKDYGESNKDKVPIGHMEKYLGYIKKKLNEVVGSNKADWIKAIEDLQERLKDVKNK